MPEIVSLEERKRLFNETIEHHKGRIVVCAGTGCIAGGSIAVYERFREVIKSRGLSVNVSLEKEASDYTISESGCQGFCQMGPLVTIYPQGILYCKVKTADVDDIVDETLIAGKYVDRLLYQMPESEEHIALMEEIPFYAKQRRLLLKTCGHIDVRDLDEYIANDGYFMARKAVLEMSDTDICNEMLTSGLKGRGGGGFPTGRKWDLTRVQQSDIKYVICNGDEGDPGAFMDRCLMEGVPHSVIEGMIIAAKAINASRGYVYVRMEYPLAVARLKEAVEEARSAGFLGKRIFGSPMDFDIEIMEGAGAFVCGEETALIASIEGKRGMPTFKPPFPSEKGLFGKPTVINNVETLCSVAIIMRMGAQEYAKMGTPNATGTKIFALTGHVANTGLIEVPFGATLREIVYDIGGGVLDNKGHASHGPFKAVQIGGPSGGCLTMDHLDLQLDYDNLGKVGAMVGSGGLVVMNDETCMVKIARYFMQFTQNESCGKCVLCCEGTRQMLSILDDICEGRADENTLPLLEELADTVRLGSLCALGKTAPNPVLSTLKHFRDEYEAHVFGKRCPTGECSALATYTIIPFNCKGCTICRRQCPVDAISGEVRQVHVIDGEKCIKCGACLAACKFDAIKLG